MRLGRKYVVYITIQVRAVSMHGRVICLNNKLGIPPIRVIIIIIIYTYIVNAVGAGFFRFLTKP